MIPKPELEREEWRVGRRVGAAEWQVKQAPGWRVAHRCATLQEAGQWLREHGANLTQVPVLTQGDWRSLDEHLRGLNEHLVIVSGSAK